MSNINTVKRIGAGIRLTEAAVPAILASLPKNFDPEKRGAIAEAVHAWACGSEARPAVKTGPKGDQKTTDYGRGHDTLVKAVKRALTADVEKEVTLRVTLSGEGGGSVTVATDSPLYPVLLALFGDES